MAIRILTDSAADFDAAELKQHSIRSIPLEVRFGDEVYLDGVTLDKKNFYSLLTSRTESPTTSQPSPERFLTEFEAAREAGDDVVAVVISSSLSGTYQSACLARELSGYEKIHIVDSRSASAGERILVEAAVHMADEGRTAGEIAGQLTALAQRLRIYAVVDTLEFLCRGGRLSKTEAQLGTLAHVKPILTLSADGVIRSRDKALGLSRARGRLLKLLEATPFDPAYPIYPLYSYPPDNCLKLRNDLAARWPDAPLGAPVGMGPTIGTHVGPGLLGLVYIEG